MARTFLSPDSWVSPSAPPSAPVRDVDWLPSPDPAGQRLWITLKRNLSGPANALEVIP